MKLLRCFYRSIERQALRLNRQNEEILPQTTNTHNTHRNEIQSRCICMCVMFYKYSVKGLCSHKKNMVRPRTLKKVCFRIFCSIKRIHHPHTRFQVCFNNMCVLTLLAGEAWKTPIIVYSCLMNRVYNLERARRRFGVYFHVRKGMLAYAISLCKRCEEDCACAMWRNGVRRN